ncbi:MAG: DUF6345 domain-containing protein, partial [candidate division KSB1 bacterium]|nr:DUF6345 domain-containing protein [candidate division KSB1 bacterium]
EGDFYLEIWNQGSNIIYEADSADFIYHAGHGNRQRVILKQDDVTSNNAGPNDQFRFTYVQTDLNQPEFNLESDYSSDGLDCDVEWVWYACCNVLRGNDTSEYDNIFTTMLYNGVHFVFGNKNPISDEQAYNIIKEFYYYVYLKSPPETVFIAWQNAHNDYQYTMGKCFYHLCNTNDYF